MAEGGWLGIAMPDELGGSGLGLTEAAIMMQAVARSGAGFSGGAAIHLNIFGPMPIVKFGTSEQKQEFLPKIIAGEHKMCFGVTEPNSGLDTTSLKTQGRAHQLRLRHQRPQDLDDRRPARRQDPDHRPHHAEGRGRQALQGLSLFYMDMKGVDAKPIPKMGRKAVESNSCSSTTSRSRTRP